MATRRRAGFAGHLGDMHYAAVALEELDGKATPTEIAVRLSWVGDDKRADEARAKTALCAAADHRLIEAVPG